MINASIKLNKCNLGTNININIAGLTEEEQDKVSNSIFPLIIEADQTFTYNSSTKNVLAFALDIPIPFPEVQREFGIGAIKPNAGMPEWARMQYCVSDSDQIMMLMEIESTQHLAEYFVSSIACIQLEAFT